ncbi:MAG: universal stress protein [Deltaproteobacteria bacterium]|nr:universal stress protein [Deltaproteobacteria bacterium]
MKTKILIAFDGSEQAQKAFSFALDMSVKYSAVLTVLSIARPPEPPVNVELQAILDSATSYYEAGFAEMKDICSRTGVECSFEIRVGHPAEQIVHFADEQKMDIIVLGHRGKSLFQRWLLGSVAKRVLSYAHCTVIVVR